MPEGNPLFIKAKATPYPSKGPQTKTEGMESASPKIFKVLTIFWSLAAKRRMVQQKCYDCHNPIKINQLQ